MDYEAVAEERERARALLPQTKSVSFDVEGGGGESWELLSSSGK